MFEEDGSLTPYMDYISKILLLLHNSTKSATKMVDLFVELDLIEPLRLDIQFINGEKLEFQGSYTISEEKLSELNFKSYTRAAFWQLPSIYPGPWTTFRS